MNMDDIIRMALEAGFDPHDMSADFTCDLKNIERLVGIAFAAGAAAEREECAKLFENVKSDFPDSYLEQCAAAIRARGNK
jgi:hypothetical protein